ncbi:MAG: alpha/beta fold hydrolase [Kofleriaceae bacterium]|nr:alpha/beta fold hydrolase [Myxococcales bacterium]MCB9560542.1 alpha/beta fold hydrolase [Kofleriaceae bacterium]MCB9573280.1 alpha/beta fold hydrolase [Kofleriaceae bacterium]
MRPPRRGYAISPADRSPVFFEHWEATPVARRAPVVLCDGIGCDGYVWRHLLDDLADREVVHWHYRGHGRTPPPRDPARVAIADLADDLVAVLDEVGVRRAVLAGHSMGVQVALEALRRHPTRVRGLILACGAPSHPLRTFHGAAVLEEILPRIQKLVARAPSLLNRISRAVLPTRLAFEIATRLEINRELVDPDDFMPYLEGMARMDVRLFTTMLGEAGRHSADDLLPQIEVPTLVIAGGRDGFTPPARSHEMADRIPGADLLLIEEGSHTAPIERPELVGPAVTRFLHERVDPARSQPEDVEIAG